MIQTIYKKDTKGNMRFLMVQAVGKTVIQTSGIVGTKSPVVHRKDCKGKNIGRSNETTPEQQALAEANNFITIKLSEEYYNTVEEAAAGEKIFPMLAKDYPKEKKKINYEDAVGIQPKLDGMRCLTIIKNKDINMYSRDGKKITTLPHIISELENLANHFPDIILDGELYAHGLNFQDNMRLIKKNREESIQIKYHLYDVVDDERFLERYQSLKNILFSVEQLYGLNDLVLVPTLFLVGEKAIDAAHSNYVQQGYEGTMVRHGNDGYKLNGRSSQLLKKKDFDDIALPLLDVVPAEQRPEWGTPVLELDGKKFQTGCRLSHADRVNLLTNKEQFIGKTAEIRYFGLSEDGVPRFPVLVGFRLDK